MSLVLIVQIVQNGKKKEIGTTVTCKELIPVSRFCMLSLFGIDYGVVMLHVYNQVEVVSVMKLLFESFTIVSFRCVLTMFRCEALK